MADSSSWIPEATAVASGVIQYVGKTVLDRSEGGARRKEQAQHWRTHAAAIAKDYVREYAQQHLQFEMLRLKPIPLDEVRVAIGVFDRSFSPTRSRAKQPAEGQAEKDFDRGLAAANECPYLMVAGEPGMGKSTFLQKAGYEALRGERGAYPRERLPIFLDLKHLDTATTTLKERVLETCRIYGFPHPDTFAKVALEQGQLLLLLDGLDEVPLRELDRVRDAIQTCVSRYPNNRFIVACETSVCERSERLERFASVTIAEFDDDQIDRFTRRWFQLNAEGDIGTAEGLLKSLAREEHRSVQELARTPLFLTFLCLTYSRAKELSANRAVLYGRGLDLALEAWAAEQRQQQNKIFEGFPLQLEKVLLSELAFQSLEEDCLCLPEAALMQTITEFLAETAEVPRHLKADRVLAALRSQKLLVERVEGTYAFAHSSLQDYLAARHITRDSERIERFVDTHLADVRWKTVFLMVASSLDRGDRFLSLMSNRLQTLDRAFPLGKFLQWAEQNTATDDTSGAAKRALALALAPTRVRIRVQHPELARERDRARERFRTRAAEIARHLDPSLNISRMLAYDVALEEAIARASIRSRDLERARALAHSLALALARAQSLAVTETLAHARTLVSALEATRAFEPFSAQLTMDALERFEKDISNQKVSTDAYVEFPDLLLQIFLDALGLDRELADLSICDYRSLLAYLDVNLLLIHCKKASVRVKSDVWQSITDRMLRPSDAFIDDMLLSLG